MKRSKAIGGALVVTGLGIAGYYTYKLLKQCSGGASSGEPSMTGFLGAFADGGFIDHNAMKSAMYWHRMRELKLEQDRLRAQGM